MMVVTVNGKEHQLHDDITTLTYDRVVRLSGMKYRKDYRIIMRMPRNRFFDYQLPPDGVVIVYAGMTFTVKLGPRKWYQLWRRT